MNDHPFKNLAVSAKHLNAPTPSIASTSQCERFKWNNSVPNHGDFDATDFELFWEENKKVYATFHSDSSSRSKGLDAESVPPPPRSKQDLFGDLRQPESKPEKTTKPEHRFPKYNVRRGKKSLYYQWASLRDVMDIEGPMKRTELSVGDEGASSLRAHLNKPPPNGVYWETGSMKYTPPETEYKRNLPTAAPPKLISASEKASDKRVFSAPVLRDAQMSGKTFQELFGNNRPKKTKPAPEMKMIKQAAPAVSYKIEDTGKMKISQLMPPKDSPRPNVSCLLAEKENLAQLTPRSRRSEKEGELKMLAIQSSSHFSEFQASPRLIVAPANTNRDDELPSPNIAMNSLATHVELSRKTESDTVLQPPEIVETNCANQPTELRQDELTREDPVHLFTSRSLVMPEEPPDLTTERRLEQTFDLTARTSLSIADLATVDELLGDVNTSLIQTYRDLQECGLIDDKKLKALRPKHSRERPTPRPETEKQDQSDEISHKEDELRNENITEDNEVEEVSEASSIHEDDGDDIMNNPPPPPEHPEESSKSTDKAARAVVANLPADLQDLLQTKVEEIGDVRGYTPTRSANPRPNLYLSLPNLRTRAVRVYLASCGEDMRYERETIIYGSVPEIQEYCKSRGVDFHLVDLSDAFHEDPVLPDPEVVDIRLWELRQCQESSLGVSAVVLVGEKYGFCGLPRRVAKEELELLLVYMGQYEDKQLAFMLYELDYNTEPVSYVFVPENIHSIFRNTLPAITSDKLSKHDLEVLVVKTLRSAFQHGAESAFANGAFTHQQKMKFFTSLLEQEVSTAISNTNPNNSSLVFIRQFSDNQSHNPDILEQYFDVTSKGELDQTRRFLLDDLISNRIAANFPPENIIRNEVKWNPRVGIDPEFIQEQAFYLQDLNSQFVDSVKRLVDQKLESVPLFGEMEEERLIHHRFGRDLCENFFRDNSLFRQITTFIEANQSSRSPLILIGKKSGGLSSFAAVLASEIRDYLPTFSCVVLRFVQAAEWAVDALCLLKSVMREAAAHYNQLTEQVNQRINQCETLTFASNLLAQMVAEFRLTDKNPLIVVIDGVNHLSPSHNSHQFHWLPGPKLPENVHVIVTCSEGEESKTLVAKFKNQDSSNIVTIPLPSVDDLSDSLHFHLLTTHGRNLSEIQMEDVTRAVVASGSLAQLPFVKAKVSSWKHSHDYGDYEELQEDLKKESDNFVKRVLAIQPEPLSRKILQYLYLIESGITQLEMRTIFSYDEGLLLDMYSGRAPNSHCSIVPVRDFQLARVFHSLRGLLRLEMRDAVAVWRVPHGTLRHALGQLFPKKSATERDSLFNAAVKYLSAEQVVKEPISSIESKQQQQLVAYNADFASGANSGVRLLRLLPGLLLNCTGRVEEAATRCLFNYQFLLSKLANHGVHALVADYALALEKGCVFAAVMIDLLSHLRSQGMTGTFDLPGLMISKLAVFEAAAPDVFKPLLDGARKWIDSNPGVWIIPKIQAHVPCASALRKSFSVMDGALWEMSSSGSTTVIGRTSLSVQELDVATQERLWHIPVESCLVRISPDNRFIVLVTLSKPIPPNQQGKAGKESRSLLVFDARTQTQLAARPMLHNYKSLCIARDSKSVFVGVPRRHQRDNSKIYVLRIDTLHTEKVLETSVTLTCVEDVPGQGHALLVGGDHNDECVVKLRTDKDVKNYIRGLKGPIVHLHACQSGVLAIAGLGMNALAVLDLKKSRIVTQQLFDNTRWMTVMRPNKSDKFVVCGDANPGVIVFDVLKGEKVNRLAASNRDTRVADAWLTDSGTYCAVADNMDNSVSLWHCPNGFCLRVLRGLTTNISAIVLTDRGLHVVAASVSGQLCVWNAHSIFKGVEKAKKGAVKCSPEESRVQLEQNLAFNVKNSADVLNIVTTELEDPTSFTSARSQVADLRVVQMELKEYLFTGSAALGFHLWDAFTGQLYHQLNIEDKNTSYTPVWVIPLPLQGNTNVDQKVCGVFNERLYMFDLKTGNTLSSLRLACKLGCLSRDRKVFVSFAPQSVTSYGKVTCWQLSSDKVEKGSTFEVPTLEFAEVSAVNCSKDGGSVALFHTSKWDNSMLVQAYDALTGKCTLDLKLGDARRLEGQIMASKHLLSVHVAPETGLLTVESLQLDSGKGLWSSHVPGLLNRVTAHVLSRNESHVVLGSDRGQIARFEVNALKAGKGHKWLVTAHSDAVTCLALNSSETTLVSGSQDGWLRLWAYSDGAGPLSALNCMADVFSVSLAVRDTVIVAMLDRAVCARFALFALKVVDPEQESASAVDTLT